MIGFLIEKIFTYLPFVHCRMALLKKSRKKMNRTSLIIGQNLPEIGLKVSILDAISLPKIIIASRFPHAILTLLCEAKTRTVTGSKGRLTEITVFSQERDTYY
jgi:hypothetical protein